jgi:hypothetical protein
LGGAIVILGAVEGRSLFGFGEEAIVIFGIEGAMQSDKPM